MLPKCKIPPASAGIEAQTKYAVKTVDDARRNIMYDVHMSVRRQIYDFLDDLPLEMSVPDDLIRRLEPLKEHIDVISIEKGGEHIDTHIYISLLKIYKQTWHVTFDTWRKTIELSTETEKKAIEAVKFLFGLPKMLEREMKNLAVFFKLPRAEQKKWMDFRQTFGTSERKGITPEIQKLIDEV